VWTLKAQDSVTRFDDAEIAAHAADATMPEHHGRDSRGLRVSAFSGHDSVYEMLTSAFGGAEGLVGEWPVRHLSPDFLVETAQLDRDFVQLIALVVASTD